MPLWTDADEEQERKLYEFNKLAFWLYPDRWKDITDPRTQCMNMEDHDMRSLDMLHTLAARRAAPKAKPRPEFKRPVVAPAADFADGGAHYGRR